MLSPAEVKMWVLPSAALSTAHLRWAAPGAFFVCSQYPWKSVMLEMVNSEVVSAIAAGARVAASAAAVATEINWVGTREDTGGPFVRTG